MILKLNYKTQTHLYSKAMNLQNLISYTKKAFRDLPNSFTFIYQSSNGEMTYIESDADLLGLKYCSTASNDYIVKLTIMRSIKLEDDYFENIVTSNLVKENLQEMYQNIFIDLGKQAQEQAIREYLARTYEKAAQKAAEAEQNIIKQSIGSYLSNLYEISSSKLVQRQSRLILSKPVNKKIVRYSLQKPQICKSQKSIDQIVSEKVLALVPSIVNKVYEKMQKRLGNKCINCLKKQKQLESLIDRQIERRLEASFELAENPEQ